VLTLLDEEAVDLDSLFILILLDELLSHHFADLESVLVHIHLRAPFASLASMVTPILVAL
jgi:hypothetical protein